MPVVKLFMPVLRRMLLLGFVLVGTAFGQAINFKAQDQYNKCAEFFQQKLFEAADQACKLAEIQQLGYADSFRLHARVALRLNNISAAQSFVDQARTSDPTNPQNDVIGAEIFLQNRDFDRANQLAESALENPRLSLKSKVLAYKITAQTNQAAGLETESINAYRNAIDLDSSDVEARLALSQILVKTDPKAAANLLRNSPSRPPEVKAEYGRIQWIAGDLPGAITTLEQVASNPGAFARDRAQYQRALGALAYAYYGTGNVSEGSRVLTQTNNSNGVFALIVGKTLPWLIAVVALLITHLVGESQIEPLSTIEIQEGPRPWTVSNVYSHLIVSVLVGGTAALIAGRLLYGNYLALLTPVQGDVARDIFFGFFAVTLVALSWYTTRKNGWDARKLLIGAVSPTLIIEGLVVGIGISALAVAYQYVAKFLHLSGFYLHLEYWRVTALIPIVLLPLTEIFFRSFAVFPIEKRYGQTAGAVVLVLLFAVTFAAPIILLVLIGAGVLYYTNREKSVIPAIVGQLVFYLVLLALLNVPIIRAWFI
jgi:tetratricopeptide (TPR) repeat protein